MSALMAQTGWLLYCLHLISKSLDDDAAADEEETACAMVSLMVAKSRIRNLDKISLKKPHESQWRHLLQFGTENAFVQTMGVSRAMFSHLTSFCTPVARRMGLYKPLFTPGRPRTFSVADMIGLALHYLRSKAHEWTLCEIFCVPPATFSRNLRNALKMLDTVLRKVPDARIRWPKPAEMQTMATLISTREPALTGVFAVADGVSFPVQDPEDSDLQNALFSGWKEDCFINAILVFTPDGCIVFAVSNAPGSWHDALCAADLYTLLQHRTPNPFVIATDSAFPASGDLAAKILKPLKDGELAADAVTAARQLAVHRLVCSVRQAAEWGNNAVQQQFPRLQNPLPSDSNWRGLLLRVIFRLYNYRTRLLQVNQIRTVFAQPEFAQNVLEEHPHYARLGQYFNVA